MPEVEEKRANPRVKLKTPVNFQIRGRPHYTNALSDDISLSGLRLINDSFIGPGTLVELRINVLSRILNPTGRIAWSSRIPHSDNYRVGVEFLQIQKPERNYLADYIDTRTYGI